MKRRDFMKAAGLATMAGAVARPALAQSMPEIRWRMASSFPTSLDALYGAGQGFAKAVADATDGKFRIQPHAPGEIVPALSVLDAVQNNTIEMGHTASYFYFGKDPTFALGTSLPFGPNARLQQAWLYRGGGLDLLNEFYRAHSIFALPAGNTGTQMGGWFRREIKSKADLAGLKIRTAGLAGLVLAQLGAVPQQIFAGDVYPALERGSIDATEVVGPYDDEKLGFHRVAPFYYFPGFLEGNVELSYFINVDRWNDLPKNYQSIVRAAAATAASDMLARYDVENPQALRRLIAAGAQLRPFPQEIMEDAAQAAAQLYSGLSDKNENFKKIHDHYMSFRDTAYSWWQISEYSYDTLLIRAARQRAR